MLVSGLHPDQQYNSSRAFLVPVPRTVTNNLGLSQRFQDSWSCRQFLWGHQLWLFSWSTWLAGIFPSAKINAYVITKTYTCNWGEPERTPHKRYSNVHNIWYMYGTSVIRTPLHRLCTGPHAIFCAEKSALKNNCDSML